MKSLKHNFEKEAFNNPTAGAYINLYHGVLGRNFSKQRIVLQFDLLIPKDDYVPEERMELIDYLVRATSKRPCGNKI